MRIIHVEEGMAATLVRRSFVLVVLLVFADRDLLDLNLQFQSQGKLINNIKLLTCCNDIGSVE